MGLICLSLLFLPVIILSPHKFILCFGLGSLIILISFIFMLGTKDYLEKLLSPKRCIFTILFLISILFGIYFSLMGHYFLSVFCAIFQLISLIVFILSFIPGGKTGINFIGRMLSSPFTRMWIRARGI